MGFLDRLQSDTEARELARQSAKLREKEEARQKMEQDEQNYRQAFEYYQQSGCERFVQTFIRHLKSHDGYSNVSGEPRRDISGETAWVSTHVQWADGHYDCWVDVKVGSDGTVAIWGEGEDVVRKGFPRIPLSEWQADPSRLEPAFELAYRQPSRVLHTEMQRLRDEQRWKPYVQWPSDNG